MILLLLYLASVYKLLCPFYMLSDIIWCLMCDFHLIIAAAVGQLKTITSALPEVESLSNSIIEKIAVLQNLLRHVVLIICSFINLHSDVYEITQPYFNFSESSFPKAGSNLFRSSGGTTVPSEARAHWHQKAVVSVIEAGGLNWLVGKVRQSCFVSALLVCLTLHIGKS